MIEEDIKVLLDTLGNFNRMSIYDPMKKYFIEETQKDIDVMINMREQILTKPL